jgi:hypothetical protein
MPWRGVLKNVWIVLPLLLLGGSTALAGEFKRFEFQPFGGFTVSGSIPLTGDDGVSHGSVHVNSSYSVGATFAVNLNELDAVEAFWQRQFTEGRLPAEFATPLSPGGMTGFDLKIDQIHCNFLHHYKIKEPRAMPFVLAGLGVTTFRAGRNGQSYSDFSFSIGGGMKYFFTDHLGIRGEARWSPTLITASDSSFWCNIGGEGATCEVKLKASLQHQLDLTGGIVFRF